MSRGNQRVQLPQIQQKQQQYENNNYNFITSKKKQVQFQQPAQQEDCEDWKKKYEDLQRDIEIRNQTIYSIQRNFESLSGLLKTEKQENAGIKEEIIKLRQINAQLLSQDGDNQQKINELQKKLKEQLGYQEQLSEEKKQNQKQAAEITNLKQQIITLETIIHRKETEIHQLNNTIGSLQQDVNGLPQILSENLKNKQVIEKQLEQISLLEKSISDKDLNLQVSFQNNTQLNSLIENIKLDLQAQQALNQHLKSEENISLSKIAKQQQQIQDLSQQLKILQDQLNNQNTVLQTRNQQDGQQNQAIQQLQKQIIEQQQQYSQLIQENKNLSEFINENINIIEDYQSMIAKYGKITFGEFMKNYQNLLQEWKIKSDKYETLQKQYLLSNDELEQIKKQLNEFKQNQNQLQQQNKDLQHKAQYYEDELKAYQQNQTDSIINEQAIKNLQNQIKLKNEKEQNLNEQINKLQNDLKTYQQFDSLILNCKKYTTPIEIIESQVLKDLKENLNQQQQTNIKYSQELERKSNQIDELQKNYEKSEQLIKNFDLEKEELKTQRNQLKNQIEQSQIIIDQLNQEIATQSLTMNSIKQDLSSSNQENKTIIKQLQDLVESQTNLQNTNSQLQKELNLTQDVSYKQGLEIKTLQTKVQKLQEELELLNPEKMRALQQQLELKEKEFQSQLQNIALAMDSQITSISCNSCMEVIQKCITCHPCGHSFCEKCFKNECPECGNQDGWFQNRRLDDLISKITYSKQILNTYKK